MSLRTLVQLAVLRAAAPPGVVVAPTAVALPAPFTAHELPALCAPAATCRPVGTRPWLSRASAP